MHYVEVSSRSWRVRIPEGSACLVPVLERLCPVEAGLFRGGGGRLLVCDGSDAQGGASGHVCECVGRADGVRSGVVWGERGAGDGLGSARGVVAVEECSGECAAAGSEFGSAGGAGVCESGTVVDKCEVSPCGVEVCASTPGVCADGLAVGGELKGELPVVEGARSEFGVVSEKTAANRAKRVRKKNRKVRKRGAVFAAAEQGSTSGVDQEVVPEWRRGVGRPSFGGGYFSGCSAKVQEELRESRARMLIQQNDLATRKARAEAQADVVARNAELKRLNLDAKLKVAHERRFGVGAASGFAETVVSYGLEDVIPVPSLSGGSGEGSGSVSPDSSISVAQATRMEKALCSMAEKVKELQLKNDVLEKRVAGSVRNAFFNPESEGVTMAEVKDAMVDMAYPAEWHMSQVSETDQRIFAEAGVVF